MSLDFRIFFCLFIVLGACGKTPTEATQDELIFAETSDAIVDVEQTPAKRQSIGNCWLYATASWAEALHKQRANEDVNLSESYWTYWHWYDQLVRGWSNEIQTGGSFNVATGIVRNYGYMLEADFIAEEAAEILSQRQKSALEAINASLKSGLLADPNARTRANIQAELAKAWQLTPEVAAAIRAVFQDGSKTFRSGAVASGKIRNATDLLVVKPSPGRMQGQPTLANTTLAAATRGWTEVAYPSSAASRRSFQKRVQRALHDRQPVILTWFVDFNSLDAEGRFLAPPATPGRQGGHMVVMEDYQASNVPGYGTLAAGTEVSEQAALQAALSDAAQIDLIRVKNSWGTNGTLASMPGHHDLYTAYLNGPVQRCDEADPTQCWAVVPFTSAVLPAGY